MSTTPPPAPPLARADPIPAPRRDVPPWPLWTLPAGLLVGIGIWILMSVVVAIAASAGGSSVSHPSPAVSLALDFSFDISFVAGALAFTVLQCHARARDFGFRRVRLGMAAGSFLTAAVGYYVLTVLYASIFQLHGKDKLPSELGTSHSTAALAGAAVFVCVVAPICEELFFRGFIFGALRRIRLPVGGRDLGTWLAALITGVLFGLVHAGSASSQYLVPLGLLGFVLCLLRWRTGSLYPCMALHSLNNAVALGVNQLGWNVLEIAGLIVAAAAVVATLTGPFAGPALDQARGG